VTDATPLARLRAASFVALRRSGRVTMGATRLLTFAGRKWRLRRIYGANLATLQHARFVFRQNCQCADCAGRVEAVARESRLYLRADQAAHWTAAFARTPLMIDLTRFPDFAAWKTGVSRMTKGKYHRSANKAARLGFTVERIGDLDYSASLHKIRTSKLWRSRGPVLEAFFAAPNADDRVVAAQEPTCPEHWMMAWGVFGPLKGVRTMVARAVLRRAGNVLLFDFFMGHADLLRDGVTKLLMFDIMKWALDRRDPNVKGIDYCFQGAAEHGGAGLVDWKRYTLFEPRALVLVDDRPFELPEGFDPKVYLELNPEVARAGQEAVHHFIYHGLHEGRPYRRANDQAAQ
jgi:hypothetical protein